MRKLICILFFSIISSIGYLNAQTHEMDSIRLAVAVQRNDTNKVNTLNLLSQMFWRSGQYDSSINYAQKGLILAEKVGFENGKGYALRNLGTAFFYKSNYPEALNHAMRELSVFTKTGNKMGLSSCYNLSGNIYTNLGDYPRALEFYFKALDINQEMGNNMATGIVLVNIGTIYMYQKNYPKALEYDFKALNLNEASGNKDGEYANLNNIGLIYTDRGMYDSGLYYCFKALKLARKINNRGSVSLSIANIGEIYDRLGKYDTALSYEFKTIGIAKITGNKTQLSASYNTIGGIYRKQKKFALAKLYLDTALRVAKSMGGKEYIKNAYASLALLDSSRGDFKAELEDSHYYDIYRDSLNTEKTLKEEMNYEFEKRADSLKAEQDKKDAITAKESQRLKVIRNSLAVGFTIVFVAAGIFFYQRRRIAKEKKRSDDLLLNILPSETAEELKETGQSKAKGYDMVTVMFSDFKSFTKISEQLTSVELVAELNRIFQEFDHIMQKNNLEKIKTIGDSYMAAGGIPVSNQTHAKDAINAAIEMQHFLGIYNTQRANEGKPLFEARIGINTGPVVAGIVGIKKFAYDIWGDTVNIASRMESSGEAGKINISGSTYELVKNEFKCVHRGKIEAKNKGEIDMYFVEYE